MSEKLTIIELRNRPNAGLMIYGEHSFEKMLEEVTDLARTRQEEAVAILNAKASDFKVTIVRGVHVQHFVREVKPEER